MKMVNKEARAEWDRLNNIISAARESNDTQLRKDVHKVMEFLAANFTLFEVEDEQEENYSGA